MPDLSRVLDTAATLTAVVTVDGDLAHWEGAWRPDAATWYDAIPEREHFASREALSRAASGGEPRLVSWTLAAAGGSVVATGVDAVERGRIERDLHELVDRDALTGLLD